MKEDRGFKKPQGWAPGSGKRLSEMPHPMLESWASFVALLLVPASCCSGEQQVMAQVLECLPHKWETDGVLVFICANPGHCGHWRDRQGVEGMMNQEVEHLLLLSK